MKPDMQNKKKNNGGAPTKYSAEMAQKLCALIATGHSLRQIGKMPGMADRSTVLDWLRRHEEFPAQYARAMELRTEYMADEILEIADDGRNDWIEREGQDGAPIKSVDTDHIQRSRLRVEARKWLMSKMAPRKYG